MTLANGGIRVDPDLLTDEETDMAFRVDTPTVDLAVTALTAATPRIQLVTFNGIEWPDPDRMNEGFDDADWDTWNANYVGDPEVDDRGVSVYVDTKSARPAAMAATVARIVTEELRRAGVTDAVIREA